MHNYHSYGSYACVIPLKNIPSLLISNRSSLTTHTTNIFLLKEKQRWLQVTARFRDRYGQMHKVGEGEGNCSFIISACNDIHWSISMTIKKIKIIMCTQEFYFIHKKVACYLSEIKKMGKLQSWASLLGTPLDVFMGNLPANYTTPYSWGLDPTEPIAKEYDMSMLHHVAIKYLFDVLLTLDVVDHSDDLEV